MKLKIRNKKGKIRIINVKSRRGYKVVSRTKRYGVIWGKIKKPKKRQAKIQRQKRESKSERQAKIARIRGEQLPILKTSQQRKVEKELLKTVQKFPTLDRRAMNQELSPKGQVLSDGKVYSSFADLIANKQNIYENVIFSNISNRKLINKIYEHRNLILRDGMVLEVSCYGAINKKLGATEYYLGTIEVTGLLIEESEFIENELIGAVIESEGGFKAIVEMLDKIVKDKGGKSASLKFDNTRGITATISHIGISFNYA